MVIDCKSPRPGGTDLPGGAICSMDHLFTKFFFWGGEIKQEANLW